MKQQDRLREVVVNTLAELMAGMQIGEEMARGKLNGEKLVINNDGTRTRIRDLGVFLGEVNANWTWTLRNLSVVRNPYESGTDKGN